MGGDRKLNLANWCLVRPDRTRAHSGAYRRTGRAQRPEPGSHIASGTKPQPKWISAPRRVQRPTTEVGTNMRYDVYRCNDQIVNVYIIVLYARQFACVAANVHKCCAVCVVRMSGGVYECGQSDPRWPSANLERQHCAARWYRWRVRGMCVMCVCGFRAFVNPRSRWFCPNDLYTARHTISEQI